MAIAAIPWLLYLLIEIIPVELTLRSKCFVIIMLFKWFSCYSVMCGETRKRRQIDSFMFISFLASRTSFVNPERYSMVFVRAQSLYWCGPIRNVKVGLGVECATFNLLSLNPIEKMSEAQPAYSRMLFDGIPCSYSSGIFTDTLILELEF